MRSLYLLCLALLGLTALPVLAQVPTNVCPPDYVPRPNQDCPGALRICTNYYHTPDSALCGEGRIFDEVVGSCGTNERNTSWYSFRAQTSGLLSFIIQPDDVTDTTNFSTNINDGNTDYDFVVLRLPDSAVQGAAFCQSLRDASTHLEVGCNFSGADGMTGLYTVSDSFPSTAISAPVQVQAGQEFVMLVDNFRVGNRLGYKIHFKGPQDSAVYADITTPPSLAIQTIRYDPACTGDCPVELTLTQPVSCQNLAVQLYNPNNISVTYPATVSCVDTSPYYGSSRLVVRGNFNPRDSNLLIVLRNQEAGSTLYQCGNIRTQVDTLALRPRPGGNYRTLTAARKVVAAAALQIAPNPFTNELTVTLPGKGRFSFALYDATGKVVWEKTLNGGAAQTLRLPSALPAGLYTAEARGEGRILRQRLTRQ